MKPAAKSPRASVLVVVLVVCLGLASIALVLGHSMLMAYRGADNEIAGRQADAAILGATQYAETLMANTANAGDVPDPSTYQSAAVPVGDALFWFIGEPADGATATDQPTFSLVDEASKLNLNRATFDMIRLLPGMTDDLALAIVNWRTAPTSNTAVATSSSGGTVSSTLSSGPIKQGFMESVDELGLVIGGTDNTLLYGDDTNLNHVLDPGETNTASNAVPGQLNAGLLEYCTVYSREPNTRSDGTTRTPIHPPGVRDPATVVSQRIDTVLGSGRGATVVRTVRDALQREGITLETPGPDGAPINTAWVDSVLEFYALSGLNATDFAKLAPYLSNGTGSYTVGLINVNTASQTVLACVPGIGDAAAAALVGTRAQRGLTADQSDWSWVASALGVRNCRAAGPYLTTRSYQWSADVAAVGRFGRGYRRTRFVIDGSTGTPQIVYRRDLAYLGWALGRDERANASNLSSNTQGRVAP